MNERVLAIVTIIAQYILSDSDFPVESDLVTELLSAGFVAEEIDAAFLWMERLQSDAAEQFEPTLRLPATQRVFNAEEIRLLSLEARGFLVRLRSLGLLDELLLEEVIERSTAETEEEVSLIDIKRMTARILCTHAQTGWSRGIESVLDDDWTGFLN